MKKKLQTGILIGLGFSGMAYGVVELMGYNSTSFTVLAYLYVSLAGILTLYHELHGSFDDIRSFISNFAVVMDEEENKLKKIVTGEKYKIKGEVEKIG